MKQGKFLMGNGVLTRLWNQYPDNMEACSAPERDFLPQMDDYFEEAIEQLDPNNQIEEDYKKVGQKSGLIQNPGFGSYRGFDLNYPAPTNSQ